MLTLLRLVLIAPVSVLTLARNDVAALALFIAAAMTDYFDGFVARRFNQVTPFGARLDASVDKIFVYVMFATLLFSGSYVAPLVVLALARDLVVEFLRQRAAARNRVIPANRWGKSKFGLQCLSIAIALIARSLPNAFVWNVAANVVLATAVVASIPGAILVWHATRRVTPVA
jgi:CDP-diacylglycerol--glycerol-3-phosphate 3-phosphatidyltransferase